MTFVSPLTSPPAHFGRRHSNIFRFPDFDVDVKRLTDDFRAHMRTWAPVLTQDAQPWRTHSLPVDQPCLVASCTFLVVCLLVALKNQNLKTLFFIVLCNV